MFGYNCDKCLREIRSMVSRYSWCVCLTTLKRSNCSAGSEEGIFTCKPEELVGLDHRKEQRDLGRGKGHRAERARWAWKTERRPDYLKQKEYKVSWEDAGELGRGWTVFKVYRFHSFRRKPYPFYTTARTRTAVSRRLVTSPCCF